MLISSSLQKNADKQHKHIHSQTLAFKFNIATLSYKKTPLALSNSKSEFLTSFSLKRVQRIYTRRFYTGRRHHIAVGWGNSHTQNIQEHQNDFFSAEIHLKITTHSCPWWGPQKDPSLQKKLEEKNCNYKCSLKFSSQLCGKTDGKRTATKGQGATTAVSTKGQGATTAVSTKGQGATTAVSTKGQGATTAVSTKGQGATTAVSTKGQGATTAVSTKGQGATTAVSTKGQGATTAVSTKGQGATTAVSTKGQEATTAVSLFKGGCNMQTAPQLLTVQLGPVNTINILTPVQLGPVNTIDILTPVQLGPVNTINILTPVQLGPVKHHQHTKTSTALHKHYQHPNTSTAWHSQTPSRP